MTSESRLARAGLFLLRALVVYIVVISIVVLLIGWYQHGWLGGH